MSIVRQERLLWTTLGLAAGAASHLDIGVRLPCCAVRRSKTSAPLCTLFSKPPTETPKP